MSWRRTTPHAVRAAIRHAVVLALTISVAGCAAAIRVTPPEDPSTPAEFWQDPARPRDLLNGPGGAALAPDPDEIYTLLERDTGGFSTTLDVRDSSGREWSAKLGAEAQSEVLASRIVWAMGYPQPPSYYVRELRVRDDEGVTRQGDARLRPKVDWLDSAEPWSWRQNPFVQSQPYRGLLVLMMVLNSTDLKDDNNMRYVVRRGGEPVTQWYAVKDLGASFGDTGRFSPERNNVDAFEKHPFIEGVADGVVEFAFKGRHQDLLQQIRPADVRWMCLRLAALEDEQWRTAFRAAGYSPAVAARYLRRIKEKIREGLDVAQLQAVR
jgi:hypothetical protein